MRLPLTLLVLAVSTACGSTPAPSVGVTPEPLGSTFSRGELEFGYPASWNVATFREMSSFSFLLVYLSTDQLHDPCVRDGFSTSCAGPPVSSLGANGVFVGWHHKGFMGWELDPSAGPLTQVGGRRAVVIAGGGSCHGIGGPNMAGAQQLSVQIEIPDASANWIQMDACLAGPDPEIARAEIDAMLQSVVWKN